MRNRDGDIIMSVNSYQVLKDFFSFSYVTTSTLFFDLINTRNRRGNKLFVINFKILDHLVRCKKKKQKYTNESEMDFYVYFKNGVTVMNRSFETVNTGFIETIKI